MSQETSSTDAQVPTQPSLFTQLTRITYIPRSDSTPPTPTRKSSKDARSGASVEPSVLEELIIKQPADSTMGTPVSDWLNLPTIAQDPIFLTPAGAFDGFDKPVKA